MPTPRPPGRAPTQPRSATPGRPGAVAGDLADGPHAHELPHVIEHPVHDTVTGFRIVGGDEARGDLGERRSTAERPPSGRRCRIRLQRRQRLRRPRPPRERRPFGRERLAARRRCSSASAAITCAAGSFFGATSVGGARIPSSGRPTRPRSCRPGRRAWSRACRSGRRAWSRACRSGRSAASILPVRSPSAASSLSIRAPCIASSAAVRQSAGPERPPGRAPRVSRFPGPPRSPEPKPWPLRRAPLALSASAAATVSGWTAVNSSFARRLSIASSAVALAKLACPASTASMRAPEIVSASNDGAAARPSSTRTRATRSCGESPRGS